MTLNDLEPGNSLYFALFQRNRNFWRPITSKWLKIDLQCLQQKCSPKNLVFSDISLTAIEVTENECIIERYLCDIDTLMRLQRSHAAIWIPCKNINASFLASTTFGVEYRLPLIFRPELTHPTAQSLCDS